MFLSLDNLKLKNVNVYKISKTADQMWNSEYNAFKKHFKFPRSASNKAIHVQLLFHNVF